MPEWKRSTRGQFAPGNRGGPGNPMAPLVQRLRSALLESVTAEDFHDLGRSLLKMAKAGDLEAVKVLLKYTVGEPYKMPAADDSEVEDLKRRAEVRKLRKMEEFDVRLSELDE